MTSGGIEHDLAGASLALARRFAAGATLWCFAPTWPSHARHVAVEFVHPVIVGKRALPAVSVSGLDPIADLRTGTRPGDVLAVIAPPDVEVARDVLRRAPAWGLTSFLLGAGPQRPHLGADHCLWVDDVDGTAPYDGRLVRAYHVLWELTHVCFEHPGLLADGGDSCDADASCITCSDEALPAEVASVRDDGLVDVRTARGGSTVDATLVGVVVPGDLLLVHAGAAIERLDDPDDRVGHA